MAEPLEKLHNELVEVIVKNRAKVSNIILALEMIKFDLLQQTNKKIYGTKIPISIQSKIKGKMPQVQKDNESGGNGNSPTKGNSVS